MRTLARDERQFFIDAAADAGFMVLKIELEKAVQTIFWLDDNAPNAAALDAILLAAARNKAQFEILATIEAMGKNLVRGYPQTEQAGWPQKFLEAKAVQDGTLAETDTIQLAVEAALTGETVASLATKTLNAAALTALIPAITAGLRRRLEAALVAAPDEAAITAISAQAETIRQAIMVAFATSDPVQVKAALANLAGA